MFEVLNEDILDIVVSHEVGRTLLEVLNEETLGVVELHEVDVGLCLKYSMKKL